MEGSMFMVKLVIVDPALNFNTPALAVGTALFKMEKDVPSLVIFPRAVLVDAPAPTKLKLPELMDRVVPTGVRDSPPPAVFPTVILVLGETRILPAATLSLCNRNNRNVPPFPEMVCVGPGPFIFQVILPLSPVGFGSNVALFSNVTLPIAFTVEKGEGAPFMAATPSAVKFPRMVVVPEEKYFNPPVNFRW
jgi:hypothetical protein